MTQRAIGFWPALLTTLVATGNAWAQERPWEWGGGMHPMGWMWGAWGIGMMLMVLVFCARHPPPALRARGDQPGRVRGEEAGSELMSRKLDSPPSSCRCEPASTWIWTSGGG